MRCSCVRARAPSRGLGIGIMSFLQTVARRSAVGVRSAVRLSARSFGGHAAAPSTGAKALGKGQGLYEDPYRNSDGEWVSDWHEPAPTYTKDGARIVEDVHFTLEWILSSPPPLHAFLEPPIMCEWPEGEAGHH